MWDVNRIRHHSLGQFVCPVLASMDRRIEREREGRREGSGSGGRGMQCGYFVKCTSCMPAQSWACTPAAGIQMFLPILKEGQTTSLNAVSQSLEWMGASVCCGAPCIIQFY